MLRLYKRIWVDAIFYEMNKKSAEQERRWEIFTLISMSVLEGLNLLTLLFIIRYFTHGRMPIVIPLAIFNVIAFNFFISITLTFFLPFVIINYLLVFANDRYKVLLNAYPRENGKLYGRYAMISIGIIVLPLLIKFIF